MREVTPPDWLGCPVCQGPLEQTKAGLHCPADALDFPAREGIFRLLPPGEEATADAYTEKYRQQREAQGWQPLAPDELLALPEKAPAGWDSLYWPVRQQSYEALLTWVEAAQSPAAQSPAAQSPAAGAGPRTVVMGAGFGWLAGRLAARGHQVVALDLSVDDAFGLGAAREAVGSISSPPALVQGDFEHPPLMAGQVDLLIYSASLHYAVDLKGCLQTAAGLLRPGGALLITDTPVLTGDFTALPPEKGQSPRRGRQLPLAELEQALTGAGLDFEIQPISRGWRWAVRQWRIRFFGGVGFTLPFIVARPNDRQQ